MKKLIAILCVVSMLTGLSACAQTCDHSFGKWSVKEEATCTKAGTEQRKCKECGEKERRDIPATGHSFGQWYTKDEADCTEPGTEECACIYCGETQTQSIPISEHSYSETVTKEATCLSPGTKTFTCQRCNDTYTEQVLCPSYDADQVFPLSQAGVGEIITYDKSGKELSLGTGFVYTSDGKIITNYHVIEGAYSAKITLNSRSYTISQVLAYDKAIDLAVLKINATGLTALPICQNQHAVGKQVYAFGSSQGLTATFSQGIITYADRELGGVHYVQHDAAISSGNSGGPLINQYCEVIGINTWAVRDSQNLNFAISTTELNRLTYGTPMTMAQLYEKECDPLDVLMNFIINYGDFSDGAYTVELGSDFTAESTYIAALSYNPDQDAVALLAVYQDSNRDQYVISLVFIQGVVMWVYMENANQMSGRVDPSTFRSSSKLQYLDTDFSNAYRPTAQSIATELVVVLCQNMTALLSPTGVTAAQLGFVHF